MPCSTLPSSFYWPVLPADPSGRLSLHLARSGQSGPASNFHDLFRSPRLAAHGHRFWSILASVVMYLTIGFRPFSAFPQRSLKQTNRCLHQAMERLSMRLANLLMITYQSSKTSSFTSKGQTIGLVGPTGSGKTSLLKLLMREYDVTNGQILLNQQNIKHYKLGDLRQLMGYVPQDQFLFATSVAENIRFGNPDLSLDQVKEAAKAVHVYEDIQDMPDRFDTMVGERGFPCLVDKSNGWLWLVL